MAAFTPSNLYVASIGSLKLTLAKVDASVTSGTNYWASAIPDIVSVHGQYERISTDDTATGLALSWTASSGTIHTFVHLSQSATPYTLYVYSGFVSKQL